MRACGPFGAIASVARRSAVGWTPLHSLAAANGLEEKATEGEGSEARASHSSVTRPYVVQTAGRAYVSFRLIRFAAPTLIHSHSTLALDTRTRTRSRAAETFWLRAPTRLRLRGILTPPPCARSRANP